MGKLISSLINLNTIFILVLSRKTSSRWYVEKYFLFDIDFCLFVYIDPCYWGPELNYEYYDEQQNIKPACKFVTDVVRYWISEYHLDGIRFDAGKYDQIIFLFNIFFF